MAKTLLEFDGKIFDAMRLGKAEKKSIWDDSIEGYKYCILINEDFPELSLIKDIMYEYFDEAYRDKKWEELKRKVSNIEHIVLL